MNRLIRRGGRLHRAALVVIVCALAGCGVPQGQGEGPGHRQQRLALTPEQELALGRQAYREILRKFPVVRRGPEVERVRTVGERIVRASEIEPLQREINLHLEGYRFEWEFNVLQSDQVNAFCLPGGKVGVFTGLLRIVENDDQLATVLSHEIAHALAHHASERLAEHQLLERAVGVAEHGTGDSDPQQHHPVVELLAGLSGRAHDRRQEAEADHIGVFLMTFAGYDPQQAVTFWQRMRQAASRGVRPPEILSDHPSDEHRIQKLAEWVPRALAAKQAFDQGRIAPAPRR
jgi:metalloendopeptidase OMA1, mitochondrial